VNRYRQTRTLITGATGQLGSALARTLAQRGEALRLLVRPGSDRSNLAWLGAAPSSAAQQVEICEGDVTDETSLRSALTGIEQLIHGAALWSFARRDRAALWRINAEGSARLARLAREAGVRRFVHLSSWMTFGACGKDQELACEEQPGERTLERIPLIASLRAAENAILAEAAGDPAQGSAGEARPSFEAVILNPGLCIGPGDLRAPRRSLLLTIATGQLRWAPRGGLNVIDVRDVIPAICGALDTGRSGERYILGGENLSYAELMHKTLRVLGRDRSVRILPWTLQGAWAAGRLLRRPSPHALEANATRLARWRLHVSSAKAESKLGLACYPIEMAIKSSFDQWLDLDQIDPDLLGSVGRV
jgi:dihydroflavonol-4-reductase